MSNLSRIQEISLESKLDSLKERLPLLNKGLYNPAIHRTALSLQSQVIRIQHINNKLKPLDCCGKVAIVFDLGKGCPFCSAEYVEVS